MHERNRARRKNAILSAEMYIEMARGVLERTMEKKAWNIYVMA